MNNNFFVKMALWGFICGTAISAFGKSRMDYKIRVAVIDTGIDPKSDVPICPDSTRDFTNTDIKDKLGHGTHVSDIIDQFVKDRVRSFTFFNFSLAQYNDRYDYCQIILKFFDTPYEGSDPTEKLKHGEATTWATVLAFREALAMRATVINYSAGGGQYDANERKVVETALEAGITIVVAAGNENACLREGRTWYPASYDNRIIAVGNKLPKKPAFDTAVWHHWGKDCMVPENLYRHPSSNYGLHVKEWEMGTSVTARVLNGKFDQMTGTSQAAAVRTGKIVRQKLGYK